MSTSNEQLIEKMQYIAGLFFRRLHEELSEPDRRALEEWLDKQEPGDRQFLEEMTDWEQIKEALHYLYRVDVSSALVDTQKKIQSGEVRIFRPWARPYKYAAAAILVILIGGAGVFMLIKRKTNIAGLPVAQRFRNDVAPGGQKAILELADGRRIVLDSAANGELVRQGDSRVLKQEDGQVSYEAAGKGDVASRGNAASDAPPGGTAVQAVFNTISTPRGGQYRVLLPDGSKVWLNAASSLRFPTLFTGKERLVTLTGEAYFEVAANASMPFKVRVVSSSAAAAGSKAGQPDPLLIEVLGTSFDIEAYPDEHEQRATLLQGAIRVASGKVQAVLQPGQQARLAPDGGNALQVVTPAKAEDVIAWKNGLFLFNDASIESVMRQVSRWYDVDVTYEGKVEKEFFGKIPRDVPVSTLLKILESTGWVHFMIEGKKITVAP